MIKILTHHKCASAWAIRYLKGFCDLNSLVMARTHLSFAPVYAEVTMYTNANYNFLINNPGPAIHIIRNPLDIVVSAYFSHRNTHGTANWPELANQRELLKRCSQAEGMYLTLAFLEREEFDWGVNGPLHALRNWNFDDPRITTLRMEDVVANPNATFGRELLRHLPQCICPPSENHTFEAIAKRPAGTVDYSSHYRSGQPDQWKELLPRPLIDYIKSHFEPILQRFYPESMLG